jgi:dihydrolipoamide dehydrogenase
VTGAGWITTDEFLQAAPNIYAIGDVNGRTLLAHAAEHQGRYAVLHALGETATPYKPGPIPGCIYGSIEVMRAGSTAAELTALGKSVTVSRANLGANAISQAHGQAQGLVKVAWVDGVVHGVTAVGHGASHLVTLAEIMVRDRWTAHTAHEHIFAHPTLDEALRDALIAPQEEK